MKKHIANILILSISLQAQEINKEENLSSNFITHQEYGRELYSDPRGISCASCHQKDGKGKILATYTHKGVKKILQSPDIRQIDFHTFKKSILSPKGIMPKYYLTDSEIEAIYDYITIKK